MCLAHILHWQILAPHVAAAPKITLRLKNPLVQFDLLSSIDRQSEVVNHQQVLHGIVDRHIAIADRNLGEAKICTQHTPPKFSLRSQQDDRWLQTWIIIRQSQDVPETKRRAVCDIARTAF